jgi:predicted RNase H-like HicB family nuclease
MSDKDRSRQHTVLFPLLIEPNDDGFLARCPNIAGAFAEGDTIEEAIFNCADVIKMIAAYRAERGEDLAPCLIEITPETQIAISLPIGIAA